MKIALWDKETDLVMPNGRKMSPAEVFNEFPFTKNGITVIEYLDDDGYVAGAVDNLETLKAVYGIDESDAVKALAEIERIRNAPPPEPTPDDMPITRKDMQLLEQHLTDVELMILEAGNV